LGHPDRDGEYSAPEIEVEDIRTFRGGLGSAWIRCPLAAARKLTQEGRVILGLSAARVEAIAKRPLQCFRYLELGHARATYVSTVDQGHLCYRCGDSVHRTRSCSASVTKCPVLCESLGTPAAHPMGMAACGFPKTKSLLRRRGTAKARRTLHSADIVNTEKLHYRIKLPTKKPTCVQDYNR
jgi:hypothetical protein